MSSDRRGTNKGGYIERVAEEEAEKGEDTARDIDRHEDERDPDDLAQLVDLPVLWTVRPQIGGTISVLCGWECERLTCKSAIARRKAER